MPKSRPPYPPQLRRRLVELVRAGKSPGELAQEFEPSEQCIRNWVAQAQRDEGKRQDGLTTAEKEELGRLRRENRTLREEPGAGGLELPGNFSSSGSLLRRELSTGTGDRVEGAYPLSTASACHATFNGLMRRTCVLMARAASHRSTARCALSQNSGELPNRRESRSAISGLTAPPPRSTPVIVWRETPNASARPETVSP